MQKSTNQELENETAGWEVKLPTYLFESQTWVLLLLIVITIFLGILLFGKISNNTQTSGNNTQSIQQGK